MVIRGVGKVGVHLDDVLRTQIEGATETGQVGGTQTQFPCSVNHMEAIAVVCCQFVGDLARTVRRIVIYDENLQTVDVQ